MVATCSRVLAEVEHCPVTLVARRQFLAEPEVFHGHWHPVPHLDVWEAVDSLQLLLKPRNVALPLLGNVALLLALLLDRPLSASHDRFKF